MKDFQDQYSPMFRDATRGDAGHCPSAGSLADLAAGRAWPWQRRRLVKHVAHCSDCADDYRVLTTARGGLITALDGQGHAGDGLMAGWLRSGLAAAALVTVAVSVSLMVQTENPVPGTENGALFVSQFEPGARTPQQRLAESDTLFASDFGESRGEDGPLFRDNFGG